MSAKDKNGLGYGTQLDEMSNKSETDSEISMSVFEVRSSDEELTPANDRFSKADGYHAVPPPITGNFLTPRADISFANLDEYAIRKKIIKSKTTELNADTSKSKTSETLGNTNEVNVEKPKSVNESVVSTPNINKEKVIIEDWNSDDEDDVSEKAGIGFKKIKACFICKSTDHLIKDCDFYAKKSPEPKLKTVVNTGQRVVKQVWDNAKRVNHKKISNKLKYPQARSTFVPSGVLTRTGLINPVRPNGKRALHTVSTVRSISTTKPVSTARPFALKIAQTGSAIRSIYPRMDNVRPRASYSPIKRFYYTRPAIRPKDLKQDVKSSGVKNMTTAGTKAVVNTGKGKMDNALKKLRWVWRPKGNYMDHESKEKGPFILKKFEYVDPKGISKSVEPHDSPLSGDHTSDRAEGALNLQELSVLCTNLSNKVLALESIKDAQAAKINHGMEYIETEEAVDKGRQSGETEEVKLTDDTEVVKDKSIGDKGRNAKELVSTARPKVSTARPDIDAARKEDRSGPDWMFDLDFLTNTMNYIPVSVENQVNVDAGTQELYVAGSSKKDKEPTPEYILLPLHPHRPKISVEDVVQAAQENPSKNSPKDNNVQNS
ncbi:hypothetical protein Tco_0662979 [Tanacetum coccineum]